MTEPRIVEWVDQGWTAMAAALDARLADLTPLYADLGELLTASTKDRFRVGTAPDGTPWVPLADGSGRTPLTLTGVMSQQIGYGSGSDYVELFMTAKQAPWHQFGTDPYTIKAKTGKALAFTVGGQRLARRQVNHPGLPARPMLGVSQSDARQMEQLALTYLFLGLDGAE